jgi:Putative esterase
MSLRNFRTAKPLLSLGLLLICATLGGRLALNLHKGSRSYPRFQVTYTRTDDRGVAYYDVTSEADGGTHVLRVLSPSSPAAGVPHNFLYVLPVEPELGATYGDGLETIRALDAENRYNLTIVEPSFGSDPWYADNPNDPTIHYESFLTQDLVPWVKQQFGQTGKEQSWLIGFSKSGIGATDLLFRHPRLFTLAAAWDFPADMSTYDQFGSSSAANYGTNANFRAHYRLDAAFLKAHKRPFLHKKRIWIGSYKVFGKDMRDFDAHLNANGIRHATEKPRRMPHRWDSGWVPLALAALQREGSALRAVP